MKYRIRQTFQESWMVGDTFQDYEFEASNDDEAQVKCLEILSLSWAKEVLLQRIDREEITTELHREVPPEPEDEEGDHDEEP